MTTTFPETFAGFATGLLPPGLSDAAHMQFSALARYRSLPRDGIYCAPSGGHEIVFVARGAVKLVARATGDRKLVVAFHFPGEIAVLCGDGPHPYSLIALRETELLVFPYDGFVALAERQPGVLQHLLDRNLLSLERCRDKTIGLGRKTAAERICGFIAGMGRRIGTESGGRIVLDLPMSRRDIADSLGLTIETVSRQFSQLKQAGLIETVGRSGVVVSSLGRLEKQAGYLGRAA